MKQNEKTALVWLAFPINAHQNAIQKPIGSASAYRAQCTLPPQPIYQTLFFNFSRVWFRDQRSVGMHLTENILKLDTPKCLLWLFSFFFFFEGGQKYVQFLTNRISIVATHPHCEVMITKWAYCSLQEQYLLTLSIYSSLKFIFSKLCMELFAGHGSTANISLGDTFQNHSISQTWNS